MTLYQTPPRPRPEPKPRPADERQQKRRRERLAAQFLAATITSHGRPGSTATRATRTREAINLADEFIEALDE